MNLFRSKKPEEKKCSDYEIEYDDDESDEYIEFLRVHLTRLIAYAESADVSLQREVAEKLANEAVKSARQKDIVEYGGLQLLLPLTKSKDGDVRRLAAHALANLSVNANNQVIMARDGAIDMLLSLLDRSQSEATLRQAGKALANLAVNTDNKRKIATSGGIPRLIDVTKSAPLLVKIETIAALANLAVNDDNELDIVESGGLDPIVSSLIQVAEFLKVPASRSQGRHFDNMEELGAQCARSLRNLSINAANREQIVSMGAVSALQVLTKSRTERIAQQATRALRNLGAEYSGK